jgi:hypothetical protein
MKHCLLLPSLVLAFVSPATGDSKVILTRAHVPVQTTIPGKFDTLEAILPALFALADQAADEDVEQVYVGGKKDFKDLIFYYRGVRKEGDMVIVSFSKGSEPYFSGSASFDATIMKSLIGTVMLYQPNAKKVTLEIDGKVWENGDA